MRQVGTQSVAIKQSRFYGSSFGLAAGLFRIIIGVAGHIKELQIAMITQPLDHGADIVKIGIPGSLRGTIANRGLHIDARLLYRIAYAGLPHQIVIGNPDSSAGAGRRTSVIGGFLDNQRLQASVMSHQGCCHPATTRADNNHICLVCLIVHFQLVAPFNRNIEISSFRHLPRSCRLNRFVSIRNAEELPRQSNSG